MEPVNKARMAEWFKATDLRPVIVRCVDSNSTSCKRVVIVIVIVIVIVMYMVL
jgi:hypothetical protein